MLYNYSWVILQGFPPNILGKCNKVLFLIYPDFNLILIYQAFAFYSFNESISTLCHFDTVYCTTCYFFVEYIQPPSSLSQFGKRLILNFLRSKQFSCLCLLLWLAQYFPLTNFSKPKSQDQENNNWSLCVTAFVCQYIVSISNCIIFLMYKLLYRILALHVSFSLSLQSHFSFYY